MVDVFEFLDRSQIYLEKLWSLNATACAKGPTKSAHVIQIWLLGGDSDLVLGSGNRQQLVRSECG